jgi:hypothetical protein
VLLFCVLVPYFWIALLGCLSFGFPFFWVPFLFGCLSFGCLSFRLPGAFRFPNKSLFNTFAPHTLERRRSGFDAFFKVLLAVVRDGKRFFMVLLAVVQTVSVGLRSRVGKGDRAVA